MSDLMEWTEARDRVLAGVGKLSPTTVPTEHALGLAVAGPVLSPERLPRFDNSAMDGFAVRAADTAGAGPGSPVTLRVVGTLAAGSPDHPDLGPGQAARIMTGARIPAGADAVVPVEDTDFWDPEATRGRLPADDREAARVLISRPARPGAHVRPAGGGLEAGAVALDAGRRLAGPEIALLLTLGITEVNVHPLPVVGVLSTGDELVPPGVTPGPGQIRDSNRFGLLNALRDHGFPVVDLGAVPDDEGELSARIAEGAERADFLLTSGGVSVGDFDLTRRVLTASGEAEAWRVRIKPGKPQVFGRVHGTPVFGLPGNPVSSLVVMDQFVLPALRRMAGRADLLRPFFRGLLAEPIRRKPGRPEFLRVRLEVREGTWFAWSAGPQGSGILTSMTRADGYVLLPADAEQLEAGAEVQCQLMTRD